MKKLLIGMFATAGLLCAAVTPAFAAANPNGQGQPSQTCGSPTASSAPNGFSSGGFANAETHYAGSDGTASAAHSQSGHAVSQYDVACYQQTQNH